MPPHPMDPSFGLVINVNGKLANEKFRNDVHALHENNTPLSDMVTQLGFNLPDRIRKILEGLDDATIKGIREATIQMLDGDLYVMPLDCAVSKTEMQAKKVKVKIEKRPHHNLIHVEQTP